MSLLKKIFGDPNKKIVDSLKPIIDKINALEESISKLTNDQLREQTSLFRARLEKGETLDDLLPESFATVRETSRRVLKQRHFDVQLIGGVVLHRGQIAEMRTGEGKTLTATLAVYLNALLGKGVHVVTVNDYLARRDAVWMGQIYHALGLTVGSIQHEQAFRYDPEYKDTEKEDREELEETQDTLGSFKVVHEFLRPIPRKEAYATDITYGTNNEFGFDYLRDNLVTDLEHMVQREQYFAIVDEVDSILIDEARTPLIISAPAEESTEMYYSFSKLVARLNENEDYNIDEKLRAATLTEDGLKKIEQWLGLGNVYTTENIKVVHHIEQALRAYALFKKDRDYVVKDGEVIIVDEFTGRLMNGRRYSEGLHQALEAKEGVAVQRESRTYATVTFQNLFRMYKKLGGMTGTAATEAEEFSKIYKLEVVSVPTHRQSKRTDLPDRVYKNEEGKYNAVVQTIKEAHDQGRPVLVGTISIAKNELLSTLLERSGVQHQVLNAKNHEREGEIIAQAGVFGGVTIATNMAGRGVDILLGGNPPDEEQAQKVRQRNGLLVIGTERHESRRIDNQLRGRTGRQGDEGVTQFYVSMEDDLMRVFGSDRMKGLMDKLGIPDDMPIENKMVSRSIEEAQKKVEGHNFDIRKHVVEYDDVINKHREIIYRRRRDTLEAFRYAMQQEGVVVDGEESLKARILKLVEEEIEHVVMAHTQSENGEDWNIKEICEVSHTIFPLNIEECVGELQGITHTPEDKLADIQARTKLIQTLFSYAQKAYMEFEQRVIGQIQKQFPAVNASLAVRQIEKDVLLRSIDTLWIEHLEAIEHLRT
ncbi:MAG: preprotein translocase subunit SecA, partial [bacterium]|nr:preprotein translocase subunit SecA [bacterium]